MKYMVTQDGPAVEKAIIDTYHHDAGFVRNALQRYLGFYFRNMRSED